MEEKNCGNCKYFRMHYIKYSRGKYSKINSGHCVKPRQKKRCISDKACKFWEIKENPFP